LISKKELKIAVVDGYLEIISLQFPGKKRMNTAELLNGMTISSTAKAL
jgi:methionyl-tRNA formyltransferase